MRYKLLILIIIICSLFLFGCGKKNAPDQVHFYYRNSNIDYGSANGAIGSELCKEPFDPLAYEMLLNTYLDGPQSHGLVSPYPNGTTLVSFTIEQQTAYVVLSDAFAELTGVELSVACACLSLTVKDITGCAAVSISAHSKLLDNQQSINIDTNALQMIDRVQP